MLEDLSSVPLSLTFLGCLSALLYPLCFLCLHLIESPMLVMIITETFFVCLSLTVFADEQGASYIQFYHVLRGLKLRIQNLPEITLPCGQSITINNKENPSSSISRFFFCGISIIIPSLTCISFLISKCL